MDDLLLSRRLIEFIIAFTLVEAVALVVYHRTTGKGVPPREFAANLASGLCLMFALRGVLVGSGWGWTACWLLGAGLAHGSDLWRRWRR